MLWLNSNLQKEASVKVLQTALMQLSTSDGCQKHQRLHNSPIKKADLDSKT